MFRVGSRIKALQRENEFLKDQIVISKMRRQEARTNAMKLAEANYYLEKLLLKLQDELSILEC